MILNHLHFNTFFLLQGRKDLQKTSDKGRHFLFVVLFLFKNCSSFALLVTRISLRTKSKKLFRKNFFSQFLFFIVPLNGHYALFKTSKTAMERVEDRFYRYIQYKTTSDENSGLTPSSPEQTVFFKVLLEELREMGLSQVCDHTEQGYITAELPANTNKAIPNIGFIAHIDTSPDASGENIKARTILHTGGDILLNEEQNIVLSATEFPELNKYIGQNIIVTDGTTLLGADDKAGVAEILTAIEHLIAHPEIKHGTIRIAFTADEEIGCGVDHFDVQSFNAEWAYTMDGGEIGELEYENFNAAAATVTINGRNIHPGYAKDKMLNAISIAMEFAQALPSDEVPEKTEGREGFFHLNQMEGNVEKSELHYIIRDHDRATFEQRKQTMQNIASQLKQKYGDEVVNLTLKDQYYNMLEKTTPVMHVVDIAKQAMEDCGVQPKISPIRGGTDGARLSFEGLPCPNIFAGGHNFHGRFEYVPVPSMEAAVSVIIRICEIVANR